MRRNQHQKICQQQSHPQHHQHLHTCRNSRYTKNYFRRGTTTSNPNGGWGSALETNNAHPHKSPSQADKTFGIVGQGVAQDIKPFWACVQNLPMQGNGVQYVKVPISSKKTTLKKGEPREGFNDQYSFTARPRKSFHFFQRYTNPCTAVIVRTGRFRRTFSPIIDVSTIDISINNEFLKKSSSGLESG